MNILQKLRHLHSRILHIIWGFSKKQKLILNGETIEYLNVSKFILWGGGENKDKFVDGMFCLHRPSKTLMIFLSHQKCSSDTFRYGLFHEFIEGNYNLLDEGFISKIKPIFENICDNLQKDFPTLLDALKKSLKEGQDRGHIVALVFEIDFAKKEMNPKRFEKHIEDILLNRL